MDKKNRHQEDCIRVRHRLEASLGKFREATWSRFLADDYVRDYLGPDKEYDWKWLRDFAERVLEYQRELEREVLDPPEEVREVSSDHAGHDAESERLERTLAIGLPERERKRADVLLMISMRLAAERPEVKRFRHERLGGQRVLFSDAEAFISPGFSEEITDQELGELARRLEHDYGWRLNDAAWFVLNGATPRLQPLTTRVYTHQGVYGPSFGKIILHVAPWIPSEEVEKAFAQARDSVRGGMGPGAIGERRLEVLKFVEEEYAKREAERERRPTFGELLQLWNQENPHWPYGDYRALSKAYREAYREVAYPMYQMPNVGQRMTG